MGLLAWPTSGVLLGELRVREHAGRDAGCSGLGKTRANSDKAP